MSAVTLYRATDAPTAAADLDPTLPAIRQLWTEGRYTRIAEVPVDTTAPIQEQVASALYSQPATIGDIAEIHGVHFAITPGGIIELEGLR
jgi:hypothetical protein